MNGEHKTGTGETGTKEPTQEELDAQAHARQDVSQHPRMQAMAAIAQKHEDAIEEQLQAEGLSSRATVGEQPVNDTRTQGQVEEQHAGTDDDTQQTPPADKQPPKQEKKAPPKEQALDLTALTASGDPVPMEALDALQVKVKIDGKEVVMPLHDLRRAAQLDGAAHARLQQANELLRQANEAVAKAGKQGTTAPPVGVEGKTGSGDSSATSKDVTEAADALVDALFVGDKEAARATVLQILQGAQPTSQTLDTEALVRQVAPAVKQQLSQEEAEEQFRSEFKDVLADPVLVSAADQFYAEASAEDPHKSHAELLTEAGTRTRAWLQARTGTPATGRGNGSTRQEKLANKERIDEVRSLNRTEVQQEPAIPTHSDVIAQMRAQRGLS